MVLRPLTLFLAFVVCLVGCERIPEWEQQAVKAKSQDLSVRMTQMKHWIFTCRGLRSRELQSTSERPDTDAQVEKFMDYFRSKNLSSIDSSGPKNILGSAFLWDSTGLLLASMPWSDGVREIECRSAFTPWLPAKVLGVDHSIDYALLRINLGSEKLGENPWFNRTEELHLDENYSVIGSTVPGQLDRFAVQLQSTAPHLSTGLDSSLLLFLPPPTEVLHGGVLVDERLRVVGFLLPIDARAWGAAVSLKKVQASVKGVLSGVSLRRPYVGFRMKTSPEEGYVIHQVQVGSPAYQAGLRPLDQLIEWDGSKLAYGVEWREVATEDIGRVIRFKFKRGSVVTEATLKVSAQD